MGKLIGKCCCCCSVVQLCLDTLRPHGLQHARPVCPSPSPRGFPSHVRYISDTIQSSHPLTSSYPSVLSLSQHRQLFQ